SDLVSMVRGSWWPEDKDGAWVVMEDREADQIGVAVGDMLTFDIGGRTLEAELTGVFRQKGLQTRFWFEAILSDGVLDPYITRYVGASYMQPEAAIAAQNEIAHMASNIVSVRTATIVATAKDLLGQAVAGLAVVSAIAFSVSLLVLTGVMASHRSRQVYYSTILHTIGARLSVIRLSLSMEYVLLAVVTSVFALALGILIALPLLHFQLRLPLTFPVWPPVVAAFGVSSICLYAGASYLMRRLQLQPATLLRGQ
ncbi:MAG: FtsX-like permease family protein, partial [Pseudomonadales bacterium]